MAMQYADNYGLIKFAGTDNHGAARESLLGGVMSDTLIKDERDFIEKARAGENHSNEFEENAKREPSSVTDLPILRDILNWVGISGGKTGIEGLIPKIGYEEMLIIGLATLLFFCSNPDRECAMILLALIFIK
jgi:hypothetical protein